MQPARDLELRVLGPVDLVGATADPGGLGRLAGLTRQQRTVLARLVIDRRRVVPVPALVRDLWGDSPPLRAVPLVYNLVCQVRKEIDRIAPARAGEVLRTRSPGYALSLDGEVDLYRFEALTRRARTRLRAAEHREAARLLAQALAEWRGSPLGGVTPELAATYGPTLAELRLAAIEDLMEAELTLGRHVALVVELTRLVGEHPCRERLRGQLMLALYRAGRQGDALECYQQGRRQLVQTAGLEPGLDLRTLHRDILAENPRLTQPSTVDGRVAAGRPRVPAHLPPTVADFVGREPQVTALRAALRPAQARHSPLPAPVCAIAGPPGVGTTALAVRVGHLVRDRYHDGQLFVDLAGSGPHPVPPGDALARFIRALAGPGEPVPDCVEERLTAYRSLLADRAVLVVLDDAADEPQIRPLLPGGGRCAVVVTSRRPLRTLDGAIGTILPPLSRDHGAALFGAASGRPDGPALAVAGAAVAQLCGGFPLAIRAAGARLAARPDWHPGQLVQDLTGEPTRLARLTAGDLDIRARIASAYGRLPDLARGLLEAATPHRDADLEPATTAARLGWSTVEVQAALDAIREAQFFEAGRYRLHELIRLYVAEHCGVDDRPLVRSRAAVPTWTQGPGRGPGAPPSTHPPLR